MTLLSSIRRRWLASFLPLAFLALFVQAIAPAHALAGLGQPVADPLATAAICGESGGDAHHAPHGSAGHALLCTLCLQCAGVPSLLTPDPAAPIARHAAPIVDRCIPRPTAPIVRVGDTAHPARAPPISRA